MSCLIFMSNLLIDKQFRQTDTASYLLYQRIRAADKPTLL